MRLLKFLFLFLPIIFINKLSAQNCSTNTVNDFVIQNIDKKYPIKPDTTTKINNPFGGKHEIEKPYSKRLLTDSTKKIETKILQKLLPIGAFTK